MDILNTSYLTLAEAYFDIGENSKAGEYVDKAILLNTGDVDAWFLLCKLQCAKNYSFNLLPLFKRTLSLALSLKPSLAEDIAQFAYQKLEYDYGRTVKEKEERAKYLKDALKQLNVVVDEEKDE